MAPAINILGLSVGLAACLIILLYVRYELTYDQWLPDSERVYQLQSKFAGEGAPAEPSQMATFAAGAALKKDFPQVEALVHAQLTMAELHYGGKARSPGVLLLVDGPFFDVLGLPLSEGDPKTALAQVGSAVLTETAARKLFGTGPALGEVVTLKFGETAHEYKITGVLKDLPKNTHLDFSMLARFDSSNPPPYMAPDDMKWSGTAGFTYLKLRKGVGPGFLTREMPAWKKRNVPRTLHSPWSTEWQLVGLSRIHLGTAVGISERPNANIGLISTFVAMAFLILGIACINFINLSTAQASLRAGEIALRKLHGASRWQLIAQFLLEASLFSITATVIALAMVELLSPYISAHLNSDLNLAYGDFKGVLLPIFGLTLFVSFACGVYPALYLSRFRPALVLRANAATSESPGSTRLRSALVVSQFTISIALIACTIVIHKQTSYGRDLDPGFYRTGLLEITNVAELGPSATAFAQELSRIPGVREVGRGSIRLGQSGAVVEYPPMAGTSEPLRVEEASADPAFFRAMGIKFLAGRNFDLNRAADDAAVPQPADGPGEGDPKAEVNVVINETAAERFGFRDPASAIGKPLGIKLGPGMTPIVVGVVADARFRSVKEPIDPLLFTMDPNFFQIMTLRYKGVDPSVIRKRVDSLWRKLAPQVPIESRFVEEAIEEAYEAEETLWKTFAIFAFVAVMMACLGIVGLAVFAADRRTKEIGLRKLLGAKVQDIVKLLVWQFSRPVIIGSLLAWPVAWWAMRTWLNGFDARILLTPTPFLIASLLAFAIATLTVAAHAVRIARAKLIDALRYE